LSEGICGDGPSVSQISPSILEKIDAALVSPDVQRDKYPEDDSEFPYMRHAPWRSVEEGIQKRHVKGRQAFRNRRRLVKRGGFLDGPPELSISAEQAEWESDEKGSKLWEERRTLWWKIEAERMFMWDIAGVLEAEQSNQVREWRIRHLEIPFIRTPHRGDGRVIMLRLPDNQEAIQEMVAKNPLFQEGKYREMWLHHLDPERIRERHRRQSADRQAVLERCQIEAQHQAETARRISTGNPRGL
jgi:hypothetical protein